MENEKWRKNVANQNMKIRKSYETYKKRFYEFASIFEIADYEERSEIRNCKFNAAD